MGFMTDQKIIEVEVDGVPHFYLIEVRNYAYIKATLSAQESFSAKLFNIASLIEQKAMIPIGSLVEEDDKFVAHSDNSSSLWQNTLKNHR